MSILFFCLPQLKYNLIFSNRNRMNKFPTSSRMFFKFRKIEKCYEDYWTLWVENYHRHMIDLLYKNSASFSTKKDWSKILGFSSSCHVVEIFLKFFRFPVFQKHPSRGAVADADTIESLPENIPWWSLFLKKLQEDSYK